MAFCPRLYVSTSDQSQSDDPPLPAALDRRETLCVHFGFIGKFLPSAARGLVGC
jgi:hypothetical protein